MAEEAEQGGERTEEPSPRRLQEAREHGQVPRSRELTTFATMIGGSVALVMTGSALGGRMAELMRRCMAVDPQSLDDTRSMLASLALGGWNFAPTALVPDFARLSPFEGVKRLLGLRGLTELGKALLKFAVVGGVCAAVVAWLFGDVLALGRMAPRAAIGRGTGLLSWAFVWLCSSLALVAIVDVPLQLFQFKRTLRMTRQEVRDEHKEHDGNPQIKQRIRQMQQAQARRRMMHNVPTADVVI